jgi:hypothetical protein
LPARAAISASESDALASESDALASESAFPARYRRLLFSARRMARK